MRQEELARRAAALLEAPQFSDAGPGLCAVFGRYGRAEVELYCRGGTLIEIVSISTPPAHRRKGYANAAMAAVCVLADELNVEVALRPTPFDASLSPDELGCWYRKHGFEPDSHDIRGFWRRAPAYRERLNV